MSDAQEPEPTTQELRQFAIFRLSLGLGGIVVLSAIGAVLDASGYKSDFGATTMAILLVGCVIQVIYGIAGVKDWLDSKKAIKRTK